MKSKDRESGTAVSFKVAPGIWRPLSITRLKSDPTPRTVTLEPSPGTPDSGVRSMETPVMRCKDSARLVSGNLPMSSATMPSETPCSARFMFADEARLLRIPTVTISSIASSSWADAVDMLVAPSASATPAASGVL